MGKKDYVAKFQLLTKLSDEVKTFPVGAAATIRKGYAVYSNSGYAEEATSLATTFLGIAAYAADNSAGAAGAINVGVYPPVPSNKFMVPVEEDSVIDQGDIGKLVDLQSANTVDISDVTVTSNGFKIEDFDAGTAAVAANTYGFAIGCFGYVS